jgi:hypothetical protein
MISIATRRCRSANVVHSRGRYQEPLVITAPILGHRDGHYVRPNRVALKYLDFKIGVDPNVSVKMLNFIVKENVETS